jgi:hypothetical protein
MNTMWLLSVGGWLVQQLAVALVCIPWHLLVINLSQVFQSILLGFENAGMRFLVPWRMSLVLKDTLLFLDIVTGSSPLSKDLRVAIIDSSKSMASPKHDAKAVPDQRVSAITPATVRFL